MEHEPIVWEAFEYPPRKRSADWYWAVAIVTVAITAILIFFGDLLFGIVVILSAFVLCLYAAKPPAVITYQLDDVGLAIEKRLYPYSTLESFWIENEAHFPQPKLIFKSKKIFMPYIIVHLHDDLHNDTMRAYLRQFLQEVHHDEPLGHKILEYLGF